MGDPNAAGGNVNDERLNNTHAKRFPFLGPSSIALGYNNPSRAEPKVKILGNREERDPTDVEQKMGLSRHLLA
jgi:hypothetical protein